MNVARLLLAVLWTFTWGTCRLVRDAAIYANKWDRRAPRSFRRCDSFRWSFRKSPKAVRCSCCGWTGPQRWATFTSVRAGYGPDCEPELVDVCPGCRSQDSLVPVLRSKRGWNS